MDSNQNTAIIVSLNQSIQRYMNGYINKLRFGIIQRQDTTTAKILYLYRRLLSARTFDDNEYLTEDEYDLIYIDIQTIINNN